MDLASETPVIIEFGRFRIVPHRRELLADGRPLHLGGRTFDVLMALIEGQGAVVSKDTLMRRVWPNRIVEESCMQAQISALRNAFGADRNLIRTISGRGYQFTGEIRTVAASPDLQVVAGMAVTVPAPPFPPTNLPKPVSELIGREDELREILGLTAAHRLVTLTGAGGIGKTRLAVAASRQSLPHFADGVWLVEFSPLADPALVPATVATAVGLELGGGEASAQRVAQALADRQLLLVLDTCEHVIAAAAVLAEALLQAGSAVHVLATSREPLRAEAEQTYPVPPLAVPAVDAKAEDDPLRYGAVRLFIDRARAAAHFAPDRSASMIAALCRRLDGIPLAIELAAACVAALGIEALAGRLDNRFQLLIGGRRAALPRHQTLRATLDWSHELLAAPERVILRRLAVFAGAFSLEAAGAVVACPELAPSEVVAGLVDLVAKSLVVMEIDATVARYRLLDTMRAYALEKLAESGERERLARRHARYYRDLFKQAETEWETRPIAEWRADHGPQIDNLRAALDWAFSPSGDESVGVALTTAAVPLWTHLSLLEECRGRVERALAALGAEANRNARREMKLLAALGVSLIIKGTAAPELGPALTRALEIAESLEDAEFQARSLWGLWVFHQYGERYRTALALAERLHTLAARASDPSFRLLGERLIGVSQHFRGDQTGARRHLEVFLAHYVTPDHRSIIRFSVDQQVTARVYLARILWLQGFPDQAVRTVDSGIEDARMANHANTLCGCLAHAACQIALWVGDQSAAECYVAMLLEHSTRHALAIWRAWGLGHQGALSVRRGDVFTGLRLLRSGLEELGGAISSVRFLGLLGQLAEALGRAGEIADGLTAIDEGIERCEGTEEHWLMAELLRVKGELLLLQGAAGAAAAAEDQYRQALDWARRQGALSWELRAATSLARLLGDQNRPTEAVALLAPVYDRFTEGVETHDLTAAKSLIDGLYNSGEHKATALVELSPGTARRRLA